MFCGIVPPGHHLFAEETHGRPFVVFAAMYAGAAAEGHAVLQPLRDVGASFADFSGVMPYVEAQKVLDEDYPKGMRYYWKSLNLTHLDDAVIERIVAHARRQPSPLSTIALWHIGGAVARKSAEESAFHGRQAVPAPGGAQAAVRPGEPVSAEPEHPTRAWPRQRAGGRYVWMFLREGSRSLG